jgi:pimeloyl-ACP methyl ester carboxylesterase
MSPTPTILLVPGSFAPPTIYAATLAHLRARGFPAVALRLPSTVKRMPLAPATMLDDADVIRRAAEALLAQGREVVVVCHSYGGTPTSQALVGLGVRRIVYLSAIVPRVGESQVRAFSGEEEGLPVEAVVCLLFFLSFGFGGLSLGSYVCCVGRCWLS